MKIVEVSAPEWPAPPQPVFGAPGVAVRLAFRVTGVEDRGSTIGVYMTVACRETGRPIALDINVSVPPRDWSAPREQVIRDAIRTAVLHEVDESITKNGHRVFDPHFQHFPDDEGPHY